MERKDYVLLPTAHYTGLWFIVEILAYGFDYVVRGFREITDKKIDFTKFVPRHVLIGHLTAFGPMGSGDINLQSFQAFHDFFNKDNKCLTIITIRDILAALISARRCAPGRLSDWIVSEFVAIAQELGKYDPLYFPIDLYTEPEDREALLSTFETRLGIELDALYKEELARYWPAQNRSTDYCLHNYSDPRLELKHAHKKEDVYYIKKIMPAEWALLMEKRPILQPFFEGLGYKHLLWFKQGAK